MKRLLLITFLLTSILAIGQSGSKVQVGTKLKAPLINSDTPVTASGNMYARPIDDDNVFGVDPYNGNLTTYDLAGWKTLSGYDATSTKSPKTIDNVSKISILYNDLETPQVFSITGSKMDMYENILSGTITLQPFTSKIIMDDDTPVPGTTKYAITSNGKYCADSTDRLLVTTT